ncbi:calmodulin-binding protein 60 A-like [Miscanthus floridulus]|uniref:calmodulin-binding protein 60 A-like n=1 Tax=Miscanthus floridulus TaxID=154761 RepID=UPI0034578345
MLQQLHQQGSKQMASSPSNLQLRFTCNKLKVPVYTKKRIYAGNGHDVEVAIYSNGEAIRSGPLSSVKVEMVVLPGDFSRENDSTAEEVDRQIVISRHGQGSVLDGVCAHKLVNGSHTFADICFREGSVRTRTREFILAARVVNGDIDGLRIQEAFMNPVTVKDRRSESNEKSDPPKLDDEVYRLKGIGKNGTYFKRLRGANIRTVEDFLKAYNRHRKNLREVVLNIMSEKCKIWETMVQHATECDIKDKDELKAYKILGENAQIFFNCVDYIVGAEFSDGYIAKENFNPQQKALVDRHTIQAYNELKSIGYHYVMLENSPVKICTNVRGADSSFPIEDAVSQPNPTDHNASFQAADNNSGLPFADRLQTIPTHANCSTAATLFVGGGGGASEALLDHLNPQVVSDGYDGGFRHFSTVAVEEGIFYWDSIPNDEFSLRESWASSDQVGYSISGKDNMIIIPEGFSPGELLASSDQANYSTFLPSSTQQQTAIPGSGNIHFDGSNQFITTSAYYPSEQRPHYCQEIEFQSGGIVVPVGNATPLVSAQNTTPKSTYISQGSDLGTSFTDGTRANAYNKDDL